MELVRHLAERDWRASGRAVDSVGVVGAGTMGSGIAISLATAGLDVVWVDTREESLSAGMDRLRSTLAAAVQKGRLDAAAAAAAIERVRAGGGIEALASTDLVIEAVYESLAVKRELFAALGKACRAGAVLASNTSTLDIDAIAAASGRAGDVVGMHFFSPANIMRLVEIVRGAATAPDVIATVRELTGRMGKLGVVVGNCFGFVGNRMLYAYGRENQLMLLEGAVPAQIDRALETFGMAMGPNAVGDLAGLDVGYRVRRERKDLPDDPRYYRVADLLVEAGRLGQKTGRGAYLYPDGSRKPVRDPEVESLIAAESARLGIERRAISDEEIVNRCLFALINEGALILEQGFADSPADIDAIWCNGYGFPKARGGPMSYADTVGTPVVLEGVQRLERALGPRYWTAAPLLRELAASGDTFESWQHRRAPPEGSS
jgi:3-hydroxyacyl-CoA dehydrogenase